MRNRTRVARVLSTLAIGLSAMAFVGPAWAAWNAATPEVAQAARDPRIAEVLAEVDRLDAALVADDHTAFAVALAPDLAVNNPQNSVSLNGATGRRNAGGLISYSRYDRTIEYAGLREGMVLLMGEERVTPKGASPLAGQEVRRRFTDLWRKDQGRWRLTARQATVISPR